MSHFFQAVLYIFYCHTHEWGHVCANLLDSAFDATFVVIADGKPVVSVSHPTLDNMFMKNMSGCALEEVVVGDPSAMNALFKRASQNASEAAGMLSSMESRMQMPRVYVTCHDAENNHFELEFRVAQGQHHRPSNKSFCGLRLMGEKRPPLDGEGVFSFSSTNREGPQRRHIVFDAESEPSDGSSASGRFRPKTQQNSTEEPRTYAVFEAMTEISEGSTGSASASGAISLAPEVASAPEDDGHAEHAEEQRAKDCSDGGASRIRRRLSATTGEDPAETAT